jgi:hypothetical protein
VVYEDGSVDITHQNLKSFRVMTKIHSKHTCKRFLYFLNSLQGITKLDTYKIECCNKSTWKYTFKERLIAHGKIIQLMVNW